MNIAVNSFVTHPPFFADYRILNGLGRTTCNCKCCLLQSVTAGSDRPFDRSHLRHSSLLTPFLVEAAAAVAAAGALLVQY